MSWYLHIVVSYDGDIMEIVLISEEPKRNGNV